MFIKVIQKIVRKQRSLLVNEIDLQVKKSRAISELLALNRYSQEPIIDGAQKDLSVSLTTFGRRINDVFLAIESIGCQTLRPGRIALWLANDEFNDKNLPISIKRLQARGLNVCYSDNIKVYLKLLPAFQAWPDDCIITIDDDVIYGFDLVEQLYCAYRDNPGIIHCGIARRMQVVNRQLTPYGSWMQNSPETKAADHRNFALGVGGVLYFPKCFHRDITDIKKIMRLSPHNDDIWYKVMCLLNKTKVQSIYNKYSAASHFIPIQLAQNDSLSMINVIGNKNDEQLQNAFSEYDAIGLLN